MRPQPRGREKCKLLVIGSQFASWSHSSRLKLGNGTRHVPTCAGQNAGLHPLESSMAVRPRMARRGLRRPKERRFGSLGRRTLKAAGAPGTPGPHTRQGLKAHAREGRGQKLEEIGSLKLKRASPQQRPATHVARCYTAEINVRNTERTANVAMDETPRLFFPRS